MLWRKTEPHNAQSGVPGVTFTPPLQISPARSYALHDGVGGWGYENKPPAIHRHPCRASRALVRPVGPKSGPTPTRAGTAGHRRAGRSATPTTGNRADATGNEPASQAPRHSSPSHRLAATTPAPGRPAAIWRSAAGP